MYSDTSPFSIPCFHHLYRNNGGIMLHPWGGMTQGIKIVLNAQKP
jgi:hypothetical protein